MYLADIIASSAPDPKQPQTLTLDPHTYKPFPQTLTLDPHTYKPFPQTLTLDPHNYKPFPQEYRKSDKAVRA